MMDYFRDGGWGMWAILIAAIATVAVTFLRAKEKRVGTLMGGCIAVLMAGMMGMATGMEAVSAHYVKFPDKVEALGQGLGELANNGTFAALVTAALGLAALAMSFQKSAPKTA